MSFDEIRELANEDQPTIFYARCIAKTFGQSLCGDGRGNYSLYSERSFAPSVTCMSPGEFANAISAKIMSLGGPVFLSGTADERIRSMFWFILEGAEAQEVAK